MLAAKFGSHEKSVVATGLFMTKYRHSCGTPVASADWHDAENRHRSQGRSATVQWRSNRRVALLEDRNNDYIRRNHLDLAAHAIWQSSQD